MITPGKDEPAPVVVVALPATGFARFASISTASDRERKIGIRSHFRIVILSEDDNAEMTPRSPQRRVTAGECVGVESWGCRALLGWTGEGARPYMGCLGIGDLQSCANFSYC